LRPEENPPLHHKYSKKGQAAKGLFLFYPFKNKKMTVQPVSKKTLTPRTRILIAFCGVLLLAVLFVPLWQIEMDAPQYPEGLVLKMHPHKLAGDVDIINGLNHYIGMKELHAENFLEFTVLPYLIIFFAVFCFVVALQKKRIWLTVLTSAFIIFGILAMVDFYRWLYNYGHDLNPAAAIIVPGQSYQPPLLGFKQLLNFGVYSIPDIGGFLFILVGLITFIITLTQYKLNKKRK
jgi:copper chaperone NosL